MNVPSQGYINKCTSLESNMNLANILVLSAMMIEDVSLH